MKRFAQWVVVFGCVGIGATALPAQQRVANDDASKSGPNKDAVLERRVTVDLVNVTLSRAIQTIAAHAHATVLFDYTVLERFPRTITLHLKSAPLASAFEKMFEGTPLQLVVSRNGRLLVIDGVTNGNAVVNTIADSTGTVTGTLTDSSSGKPVGQATVKVVGTQVSTVTSDAGRFVLRNVPLGTRALSVRFVGYRPVTREITVTSTSSEPVRIVLSTMATQLSGVVTTAAGVQQRQQVGTDITVLNADSIQNIAPVSSLTDLLETRVPGLTVIRSSGQPGAPRRLRLRGTSSIERSNDPIVIVDGVRVFADQAGGGSVTLGGTYVAPSPLDQIDPNTIQTVEVFKGPSASALYGADAGNGVIVITTKRGRAGKTRWTTTLETGRAALPGGGYPVNTFLFGHSAPQFNPFVNTGSHLCDPYSIQDPCVRDSLVHYQALNDPRFDVFAAGRTSSANLMISGGVGSMTYALGGSATEETGLFQLPKFQVDQFTEAHQFAPPQWMRRPDQYRTTGGNARLDFPLGTGGGTFGLTTNLFRSDGQQSSLQSAISALMGRYIDTTVVAGTVLPEYYTRAQFGALTFTNSAALNWPIRPWLPLMATAGFNLRTTNDQAVLPRGYVICNSFSSCPDSFGRYRLSQGLVLQPTLNLGTIFRLSGHGYRPGASIPIGFNYTAETQRFMSGSRDTLQPGVTEPFTLGSALQSRLARATYGWYVAPTFDVGGRLYVSPGFRFDGGTASGSNARYSPFPKIDISWLAIAQPESPVLGFISSLRPRLSFGIAGVQPAPNDQYRLFRYLTVSQPGQPDAQALRFATYGNTKLRPERSREFETGIDAQLWDQRAALTVTAYRKLRYDAILQAGLPPSTGGGEHVSNFLRPIGGNTDLGQRIRRNIGNVRNTGIEATADVRVVDTRFAQWQIGTKIQRNTNVLLTLAPGESSRVVSTETTDLSRLVVGYPLFGLWAQPLAGFTDVNGNNIIEPEEIQLADSAVFLGAQEPNYQSTVNTSVSLFNGQLNVATSVDYQNGMAQLNQAASVSASGTNYNAFTSAYFDPHTTPAQQAAIAAYLRTRFTDGSASGSLFGLVQRVNTLRWQSLSVAYRIPTAVVQRMRLTTMSVALQGENLGLKTNYRGKDPNVGALPGASRVTDNGQLPAPRKWQLRITMGN